MYKYQSVYQLGKVTELVINWTEKMNIPLSPFSSCPATVCSLYTLRLNLVLTRGIPPDFRGNVHLFVPRHTPSGQSRVNRVAQLACRWLSLPRVRRHRASGPQGSLVPSTSAAFIAGITMDHFMCSSFLPHPLLLVCSGHVMWHKKCRRWHCWWYVCYTMYVGMIITYKRVWIDRVRLPNLLLVSWTEKMKCPYSGCIRGKYIPATSMYYCLQCLHMFTSHMGTCTFKGFATVPIGMAINQVLRSVL